MPPDKIIRSICWFCLSPSSRKVLDQLNEVEHKLTQNHFTIQTKRVCFRDTRVEDLHRWQNDDGLYLSIGTLNYEALTQQLEAFLRLKNVSLNLDLTEGVDSRHIDVLFRIIHESAPKTFQFTFTFNNPPSSPFFPSATFERPGFAVGLQPTDLSQGCDSIESWLLRIESVWIELCEILDSRTDFLGIDASVAPLFTGNSSLVHFIKKIYGDFSTSVTTDAFIRITNFLTQYNPRPVGLCGLMLPCLEDFELAVEYEAGRFSIERNIFLSLHSGLGIDTYPIGIDECPERIQDVLCLLQKLSTKYKKPLSARFVSDGKARVGDVSDFQNPYLKDVKIRPL